MRDGSLRKGPSAIPSSLESALKSRSHTNVPSGGQLRGTSNEEIMDVMPDIRGVADLQRLQNGKIMARIEANVSRSNKYKS